MGRRWSFLLLGAAIVASTLLLLHLGRGQTLVGDEWGYLYGYRSWAPHTLLTPHNGHLIVLPLLVYKAMFAAFGIGSQLPYQLVTLAMSSTVAILLFALLRNGVGEILALAAAILILFYGAGADVILPTFQLTNLIGLAAGLAMLLALRRRDIRGDVIGCLLLTMSLASFSIGVAFAVGAGVMLSLRPAGTRLNRAWVVALPVVMYAAWVLWARKFGQETIYVHNLKVLGSALVDQLGAVLAGLTGLFTTPNGPAPSVTTVPIRTDWAPALIVGLVAILIVRLRRPPRPGPNAFAAVAVLVSYFLLVGIALNIYRNTFDTRLVYLGSVLTLLAVGELCAPYRPNKTALVVIGAVFVFSLCANVAELGDVAKFLRAQSASNRARLAAVELAGRAVAPEFLVEEPPGEMSFNVEMLHQVDAKFGSPAYSVAELKMATPGARLAADEELVRALAIEPRLAGRPKQYPVAGRIVVRAISKGKAKRAGACVSLAPRSGSSLKALVQLPTGGMAYASGSAPVGVSLGRFADAPAVALPQRSGSIAIQIPVDTSRTPWLATIKTTDRTLVCPAGGLA